MNKKQIVRSEFIGSLIEIVKSKNPTLIGVKGKIVDETKNTIKIKENGKIKTILKNHVTFHIHKNDRIYEIDGKMLNKKPEDRTKK